jgi:2-polyprenyl-3-methyl-5-hydroxy-6-metoxy-1,4-benzoquinol methylase
MKQHLKERLLGVVSGATRRHAVLLSQQAGREETLLRVRTRYRVDGDRLDVHIDEPGPGTLSATLIAEEMGVGWDSGPLAYSGPATLSLSIASGNVRLGEAVIGSITEGARFHPRRFSWFLTLEGAPGSRRSRRTGHYMARDARSAVDAAYFTGGEDYIDYEFQSESVHAEVLRLMEGCGAAGPVLEIGSATGGTLARLRTAGFDGVGVDTSEWAIGRAAERLGPGIVHRCEAGREALPAAIVERAPFKTVILASVFEHFDRPFEVLASLTPLLAAGAHLILLTTNAGSLTHRLFGADWEGYFDWTHHGIDQVSARSIRELLPQLGWRIVSLRTWHIWDGDADPTKATLREWVDADARFRQLLEERDLGDFINCVAQRA